VYSSLIHCNCAVLIKAYAWVSQGVQWTFWIFTSSAKIADICFKVLPCFCSPPFRSLKKDNISMREKNRINYFLLFFNASCTETFHNWSERLACAVTELSVHY
jgi:hypothetical protein